MENKQQSAEFLNHLRAEKLRTQQARTKYVLDKLTYATALLGLGSLGLEIKDIDLTWLLYLVPLVAFVFDFYIMGEDYSIKRIGAFVGVNSSDPLEHRWERWVSQNRDPFAPLAMPLLTTLLLVGSAVLLITKIDVLESPWFWIWMATCGTLTWGFFAFYHSLRRRVLKKAALAADGALQAVEPLLQLIAAVEANDHLLNTITYHSAKRLFLSCLTIPQHLQNIQQLAPEYGRLEFLRCVDDQGRSVDIPPEIVQDFDTTIAQHPGFGVWFRKVARPEQDESTLLVARWLCHLVGLRHITAHLFIDHPHLPEHTLVQVRALDKAESPGCFDLPVAGHVVGLDPVENALIAEMAEELHLEQAALKEFAPLGSYNCHICDDQTGLRNVEHRVVYRSRLDAEAWPKLSASSPEVAAVASFALMDLKEMVVNFPDRVASGLRESFSFYSRDREQA